MPIIFKTGNMFDEPTEAILNTVNVVGVMGAGVALEFKKRWPENFKAYKKLCDAGQLRPGVLYVHDNGDLLGDKHRYLVNFPTKVDWRNPSKIEYIEEGLDALIDEIHALGITSIAIPPLGCGNGGLDWDEVRPLIVERLQDFDDVDIIIFEPGGHAPSAPVEAPPTPSTPKPSGEPVTFERALLLKAIDELPLESTNGIHDVVESLQRQDIQYGMQFAKHDGQWFSPVLEKAIAAFVKRGLIVLLHDAPVVTDAGKELVATLEGPALMRANRAVLAVRNDLVGPEPTAAGATA